MAARSERREGRGPGRAAEASRHTTEMSRRFESEIARALSETRAFDGIPAAPRDAERAVPAISVVDEDTVAAVLARGRGIASACDLTVLDFASFTQPGGGYDRGTMAQEQSLCAASFLYNVLSQRRDWYAENRRRNLNCHLYRNRALVVPRVRFERDGYHSYADVIVAAAPDARRAREEYHVGEGPLADALAGRVRLVLAIADELAHERLVLGAFGCGVFGWDPAQVAEAFRAELARGMRAVREVVFAVPSRRADENLDVFSHALATFPERNPEPYRTRAERAAQAARESAVAPEPEEDDWRRYL